MRTVVCVLTLCGLSFGASTAGQEITRNQISGFRSEGVGLVATILRFSEEEKLPVAIEFIDAKALRQPLSVALGRMSIAQALDTILRHAPLYHWRWQDGILRITNENSLHGSNNLFDTVIPVFELKRKATVQEASVLLSMSLQNLISGSVNGYAGDFDPGDVRQSVGPVKLLHETVAEILSYIVVSSGAAAWLVTQPPDGLAKINQDGLWMIVQAWDSSHSSDSVLTAVAHNFR